MQLQNDIGSQVAGGSSSVGALIQSEADTGLGPAGRAGILNSVSEV